MRQKRFDAEDNVGVITQAPPGKATPDAGFHCEPNMMQHPGGGFSPNRGGFLIAEEDKAKVPHPRRFDVFTSHWLVAALLVGCFALDSHADVTCADIRLVPEKYLGRQVATKGTFSGKSPDRRSFNLKQGNDTIEVFYELLPPRAQALISGQENSSKATVTVRGVVQRFRDQQISLRSRYGQDPYSRRYSQDPSYQQNSYYLVASSVEIIPMQREVGAPARTGRTGTPDSNVVLAPVPAQPKPPTSATPVVREPSRPQVDRKPSSKESGNGHKSIQATVFTVVGLVVLLTSIWVGFDAQANQVAPRDGPYSPGNGALTWVLACVVLWIAAFPYYLVRRSAALRGRPRTLESSGPPPVMPAAVPAKPSAEQNQGSAAINNPTGKLDAGWKQGKSCYYVERNKSVGPMEEAHLHVLVKGGQLDKHKTLIWQEGLESWWFYDEVFNNEGGVKRRPLPADAPPLPASRPPPTRPSPSEQVPTTAVASRPQERVSFVKGVCQHCGVHLEFSSLMSGQTITCPHCRKETLLQPTLPPSTPHPETRGKPLPVGVLLGRPTASSSGVPQPKGNAGK